MDSVKLLIGIVSLATMLFGWWLKNDADKKKRKKETDDEIDSATTADDWLRIFHKLRDK